MQVHVLDAYWTLVVWVYEPWSCTYMSTGHQSVDSRIQTRKRAAQSRENIRNSLGLNSKSADSAFSGEAKSERRLVRTIILPETSYRDFRKRMMTGTTPGVRSYGWQRLPKTFEITMRIKPVWKRRITKLRIGRYMGTDGRHFGFYIRVGRVVIELV